MVEPRATRDLVDLPLDAVLVIFQYIGPPETFLGLSEVCLKWNAFFSKTDLLVAAAICAVQSSHALSCQ
jgi:hypothetical protein